MRWYWWVACGVGGVTVGAVLFLLFVLWAIQNWGKE